MNTHPEIARALATAHVEELRAARAGVGRAAFRVPILERARQRILRLG